MDNTQRGRRPQEPHGITIERWRQFRDVDIRLGDRLTVLVGPNGTGKSTLLSLLALLLGERQLSFSDGAGWVASRSDTYQDYGTIASMHFADGDSAPVVASPNKDKDNTYRLSLRDLRERHIAGSFHHATKLLFGRRLTVLRIVGEMLVPVGGSSGDRAYVTSRHIVEVATLLRGSESSFFDRLRRQWDNWALFSAQSTSLLQQPPNLVAERLQARGTAPTVFERFAKLFQDIVGESTGIIDVQIYDEQLVAQTVNGSFSFDALSHGLAFIATLLWDCVLLDSIESESLVLIDEPENHLHPGLQRKLMTTLVGEFQTIRFVIATHSPFFVGAERDSLVCLLALEEDGYVHSRMLSDYDFDRAGTANDVLRQALGTTTSRPQWLEDELKGRLFKYVSRVTDRSLVDSLHEELRIRGQAELLPDAIRILKNLQDQEGNVA